MKKVLLGSALLLTVTLFAQPGQRPDGPPKPLSIADRWKHDSTRLQLYVVLSANQLPATRAAFTAFYTDMDALMQKGQGSEPKPPAKEEVDKLRTKRDAALKAVFNAQQFDRFEVFGREFMPPPPHPPKPRDNNQNL